MAQRETRRAHHLARISEDLEILFRDLHHKSNLQRDPLGVVCPELAPKDFEIVSFVSAGLSYGREEQIRKSLGILWQKLQKVGLRNEGEGIHELLVDNSWKSLEREFKSSLKGWIYRFNDASDIVALFKSLKTILENHASLGEMFATRKAEKPEQRIQLFCDEFRKTASGPLAKAKVRWFTCAPAEGSTCKRLMMYLRWMLRADEIDPGHWVLKKVQMSAESIVGPEHAFIPMDTHIHKWATTNKIVTTKNPSWKSVVEVTDFLKTIDAKDPVRFDFCICHSGMIKFREKKKRTLQQELPVAFV